MSGVLVVDGNSIPKGFGVNAGEEWPAVASPLIRGSFTLHNVSVNGQTMAQMRDTFSDVSSKPVGGAAWAVGSSVGNVLIEMGGRNSWVLIADAWDHFL